MQESLPEIIKTQIPFKPFILGSISILLFIGYALWTTIDTGTITVQSSLYGSQVFIDTRSAGVLKSADPLKLSERAGTHDVIVSKDGYWPWMKAVELKKHETIELHPFLVSKKISMESIPRLVFSSGVTGPNPEYVKAWDLIENSTISKEAAPLVEATGIEGVTHADFAPERTDVLLVAAKDGVFAIGTENSVHPNFQPVYQGANPSFVKTKDNAIYIKDGETISLIKDLKI